MDSLARFSLFNVSFSKRWSNILKKLNWLLFHHINYVVIFKKKKNNKNSAMTKAKKKNSWNFVWSVSFKNTPQITQCFVWKKKEK